MKNDTAQFIREYVLARGGKEEITEEEKTALAEMSTTFDDSQYQNSHGKKPRGRGAWAFSLKKDPDVSRGSNEVFWSKGSTTLADAKKQARKHYPGKVVYILP